MLSCSLVLLVRSRFRVASRRIVPSLASRRGFAADDTHNDKNKTSNKVIPLVHHDDRDTAPSWALEASERVRKQREEGLGKKDIPPTGVKRVFLYSCCAPCSGAMVEEMRANPTLEKDTVFFYKPSSAQRIRNSQRRKQTILSRFGN